ncbi:anti-sigma factor family protein [Thalassoglobus sp.]|uniref:anti-sigma factor family protein n=1 Tax=Thalassoglobus sp. TaxID=2795869 RepID=UPI003AA8EBD8
MSEHEMTCKNTQSLLSHFFDHQLDEQQRETISEHLEHCSDCSRVLNDYKQLSVLNQAIESPQPPANLWAKIQQDLDGQPADPAPLILTTPRRQVARPWVVAVLLLMVFGISFVAIQSQSHDHQHTMVTIEFDEYLDSYAASPQQALKDLFSEYPQRTVSVETATKQVGYRPVVANSLPSGYTVESIQLLKMPCCECVKTMCTSDSGDPFVVFEHDAEQAIWFGHREKRQCDCGGKPTTVMEFDQQIAATWRVGKRSVSVVGLKDVQEVEKLMPYLGRDPSAG